MTPAVGFTVAGSFAGDVVHGLVEGQPQDLDKEVDGVTFQAASVPVPIGFLDDEAGEGGQLQVARLLLDQLEALKNEACAACIECIVFTAPDDPACWPPCALCIALTLWGQNN